MRFFCVSVFLTLVCGSTWCKAEDVRNVLVDGAGFAIPLPAGYVDLCESDGDAKTTFPSFIPPENSLLGCYTTPKDLAEWKQGAGGVFSSYLIATVVKGTIKRNLSAAQFAVFSRNLKKTLNELAATVEPSIRAQIDHVNASLSDKYKTEMRTSLEAMTPLGVFDEGPERISTVWLTHATHEVGNKTVDNWQVQISSTVLVGGKAFVLFTYGKFDGPGDVRRYKGVARAWAASFLEANRRAAGT